MIAEQSLKRRKSAPCAKSGTDRHLMYPMNENDLLRARLLEAEETLEAIRTGEVDALVVSRPEGEMIVPLAGVEEVYRLLVEAMNEGALVLGSDGTIIYCNAAFAGMLDTPLEGVLGSSIFRFVAQQDMEPLRKLLQEAAQYRGSGEIRLTRARTGDSVHARIAVGGLELEDVESLSAVVTDITERKRSETELEQYRERLEELVGQRTRQLHDSVLQLKAEASRRIKAERVKEEMYQRELHIAEMLQKALMPDVAFASPLVDMAARYRATMAEASVGGDFFDVFELDAHRIGVLIGDVAGKGLAAAMQVAAARHTIRSYAFLDPFPGMVLALANNALSREPAKSAWSMLTVFFAVVDTRDGSVSCASGGHDHPLIRRADGRIEVMAPECQGQALGVFSGCDYGVGRLKLGRGDTVVMFTDGLTEARAGSGLLFGVSGLEKSLSSLGSGSVEELADGLLEAAERHAGGALRDDAALLIFRMK